MYEDAAITPGQALTSAVDAGIQVAALCAPHAMVYSFPRVGAAIRMRIEDIDMQVRRTWVRLPEGGGKQHEMPCHHNVEA